MKKFIIALMLTFLPTVIFAQSAFDKYEDKPEITSVIVTKKMFQLMGEMKLDAKDKDAQQYLKLVKKLENLKVFTTESAKFSKDMKATVDTYLKAHPLDELMRINDGGNSVKIFVKSGATASQVKELLMFVDGTGPKNNTVLLSLTGSFDLADLSVLTDKMNLPGGKELKKAAKK